MLHKTGLILIFFCSSTLLTVRGTAEIKAAIDEALKEAPSDFLLALKATRRVFETLAQDDTTLTGQTVNQVGESINTSLTNLVGSTTFRRIISHFRETLHNQQAHHSIVKIANTLHLCFTYDVKQGIKPEPKDLKGDKNKGGKNKNFINDSTFPWRDFRKVIHSDQVYAIPLLYSGFWDILLDPKKSENLQVMVNFVLNVLAGEPTTAEELLTKDVEIGETIREISHLDNIELASSVINPISSVSKVNNII